MKALAAPLLVALLALTGLVLLGCDDEDVGVPCQLPGIGAGTGTGTGTGVIRPIVITNALDCRSRLCVRPASTSADTKPLCTKICESDSDCPDQGDTCPHNERFVCQVIQEVGTLAYCKMCVCKAFITGEPTEIPAGTKPTCPEL